MDNKKDDMPKHYYQVEIIKTSKSIDLVYSLEEHRDKINQFLIALPNIQYEEMQNIPNNQYWITTIVYQE